MPHLRKITVGVLALVISVSHAQQGVVIRPEKDGTFVYADDFATPRCLSDAFLSNTGVEVWTPGSLQSRGPARHRTLTYRFHGDGSITGLAVTVQQKANARHLGGQNWLHLSTNGLDWQLVGDSATQPGDANAWQGIPFQVGGEAATPFLGGTEVWLRLVMDNHSGLETHVSNIIEGLEVKLALGDPPVAAADAQAALRSAWGRARQRSGWHGIALDVADPPGRRAPHYYEDADGWLRPPGEAAHLLTDETEGFRAQRVYAPERRSPLSLVTFVRSPGAEALLARVTVLATGEGSRRLQAKWGGRTVAVWDAASFLPTPRTFFARLSPCPPGIIELGLEPADQGVVTVREIALVGPAGVAWAEKPRLRAAPPLAVISAQYLPDPAPPPASQAVEGRHARQGQELVFAGLQRLNAEHAEFGALRVTLRNPSPRTIRVGDGLLLNGKPIAESYVDFTKSDWDARGVLWHRMRPQTLLAGQCGELYIRFRRRPAGEAATLTIPCENAAPVRLTMPYAPPSLLVDYVVTDHQGRCLHVYLRNAGRVSPGGLRAVALDGRVLRDAQVHGGDFRDGVCLIVARLPRPLAPMSFHVVTARTASGAAAGAQFRVQPRLFPRSSIHVPSELCREMNMNLGMWHLRSLEECRRYGLPTTTNTDRMFDAHERVRYILGPDEPDANDNRGGGYDRGLGYQARRLRESGWTELVESQAPQVASWIIMNGTTRPLNWCVYGQLADIACFDPYPINFYGADHAYVRESLGYARQCGLPRPMYACLEAFGWSAGQGVPASRRGPTPAEWRQNVVQALGSGAKGLTSWVYVAGAGGWQLDEPVRREMARVNGLIARIEDLLLLGTPVDWATTDAGTVMTGIVGDERWPKERVWAGALLCGPDAIVVTVANHIPAAKPGPPTIEPARNVTVTVRLPEFLRDVSAVEVTEEGMEPVACTVHGGKARLLIGDIESGRVFVLTRR